MTEKKQGPKVDKPPGSVARSIGSILSAALLLVAARGFGGAEGSSTHQHQGGFDETTSASPKRSAQEPGRGRDAASPQHLPVKGWWDVLYRVYEEIGRDRILAVAAGVTFYVLLAIFPAIGAFVSLYGLVADPSTIGEHLADLGGILPGGAVEIIGEQVKSITSNDETALGFTFFSGLAISLWSANAGMKAVFDALNIAYEEHEKRNFVWLNVWSLTFTVGMIAFLAVALSAVVVVPAFLAAVGLGTATEWLIWIGRWPVLLAVTLGALALLYRYGPSRDRAQWRWLAPGAVTAAVGWLIASMFFSWYAANFGSYNKTYGSLGAVIGFMTWIWLSVTIVLVGAELNAEAEHQTAEDTTEGAPQPMGVRGARVADAVGQTRD